MKPLQTKYLLLALMVFTFAQAIAAQTTTFTYQGRLTDASTQANGTYDLGFALFDSATGGSLNSFYGRTAGRMTIGGQNAFFGAFAGISNFTGSSNSAFGASANMESGNLTFATAVGSDAIVKTSDTIVRGKTAGSHNGATRPADAVQIPGTLTVAGNVTTGGTLTAAGDASAAQYSINGSRVLGVPNSTSLTVGLNAGNALAAGHADNTFVGNSAGVRCQSAVNVGDCLGNTFLGRNAGAAQFAGNGNTFIGINTDNVSLSAGGSGGIARAGSNNTLLGARATLFADDIDHATAIGADAAVGASNTIIIGRNSGADSTFFFGVISGVKYDRMSALFVNAFKEQQTQIERQQKQIDELKNIVCAIKPDAEVCKSEDK